MTIQEEIREELAKRRYYDGMVGVGSGIPRWEDRTEVEREYFRAKIDEDFQYLHSKKVRIEVERELPEIGWLGGEEVTNQEKAERVIGDMLKWHNESLEPLIKEKE